MEETDVLIVGAGVVGLAIAQCLCRDDREIIVIEKNESFGRETSSRNSEVIHAGIYYPSDSLKAKLCVPGNRMLYDFCSQNNIPFQKSGKIIVGNTPEEIQIVQELSRLGTENGVPDLKIIDSDELQRIEPHVRGEIGLISLTSGIVDTHSLMATMEQQSETGGVTFAYGCEVIGIENKQGKYHVTVRDSDGETLTLASHIIINAAGLQADTVAQMSGIDIDEADYRLLFCKGEYFGVASRHRGKLSHLVYPPPTKVSLGTHSVLLLDGSLKLGPNAYYVDTVDYSVNTQNQQFFYESSRILFPFIEYDDLFPDMAGVRPKLQKEDGPFRDFVIRDEADRGFPGLINLIGIESPGLTASLSIAVFVEKIVDSVAK